MKRAPLVFLFTAILCSSFALENPIDYQDEGQAIFTTQLGDTDVEFFLTGSWELSLYASTGILIRTTSGGIQSIDSFPGIPMGFLFNQVPDITASVWLMKKYFLEFSYLGNFENNRFLAGYVGEEKEWIRHIYIGNKDIGLNPYRFLEIPKTGQSSIGIEALLASDSMSHNLLLRYDNNDSYEKLFVGKNEVTETRISPIAYVQGMYLRLPDHAVDNFVLYLEDPLGIQSVTDGRKYRKALASEYSLDAGAGRVILQEKPAGRVLCYYTKGSFPVGDSDSSMGVDGLAAEDGFGHINETGTPLRFYFLMGFYLGQNMSARRIVTDQACLLLWEPNSFSPFENPSQYPVGTTLPEEQWRYKLLFVPRQSWKEKTDFSRSVSLKRSGDSASVISAYFDSSATDYRNVYPLPDPDHLLYGPTRLQDDSSLSYEILLQVTNPIDEYYLDRDIIAQSVHVLVNDVEETRFDVDYGSGRLVLNRYIHPDDRILVTYKKKGGSIGNGDLLFAWGNTFNLLENLKLELATGLRWNILPGSYTEKSFSRTGAIIGMAGLKSTGSNHAIDLSAGVSFTHPDTTGNRKIIGMEESGIYMDLTDEYFTPSSPPAVPAAGYDKMNRGKLFYKNYREYDLLGNGTLKPITWSVPPGQVYPYVSQSKSGPYSVYEGAGIFSASNLVMDLEIEQANGWVGVQTPVSRNTGLKDLTSMESVSFCFKAFDVSGAFRIYLQLGDIGEDLDQDGILDREASEADTGYPFDDSAHSIQLRIGGGPKQTGNFRLDSEDIDGNGFLDPEEGSSIVSLTDAQLAFSGDITSFRTVSITVPSSVKSRLSRTRGVRIIAVNEGAPGGTAKIMVNAVFLSGTSVYPEIVAGNGNGETVSAREIDEYLAVSLPPARLEAVFSPVASIFHSHGETQKVLEIQWNALEAGESWKASRYNIDVKANEIYRTLRFYIRLPQMTGAGSESVAFAMHDDEGNGIDFSFTPAVSSPWQEVRLDLFNRRLYLNGSEIPATVTISPAYDDLILFTVQMTGSSSGVMYLDEVHMTDPQGTFGFAIDLNGSFSQPGEIITVSGIPLISDFSIKEIGALTTKGFSSLYGQGASDPSVSSLTDLSVGLFPAKLDVSLLLKGTGDGFSGTAGHRLQIPKDPFYVVFTDTYNLNFSESGRAVSRENTIKILPELSTALLTLSTGAFLYNSFLIQNWQTVLGYTWPEFITVSASLKLSQTSGGFVPDPSWYLESWIRNYSLILPHEPGTLQERDLFHDFAFSLAPSPVGAEVKYAMDKRSVSFIGSTKKSLNSLDYSVALPLRIANNGKNLFSLTASYKRLFTFTAAEPGPGDYGRDAGHYFEDLAAHPLFVTGLPFYELFSDDAVSVFNAQTIDFIDAHYSPALVLSLMRDSGSYWYDLILPALCEFNISREINKLSDSRSRSTSYGFNVRTNAINLFGKFGAYSMVPFYTIDEFMLGVAGSFFLNENNTFAKSLVTIENYLLFETEGGFQLKITNDLSFVNEIQTTVRDTCRISFDWNFHPEKGIELPLMDRQITSSAYITHSEIIEGTFASTTETTSFHPATLVLTHKSGIAFPEHGYIQAMVSFGFDEESAANALFSETYIRLGLRGGIEIRLNW